MDNLLEVFDLCLELNYLAFSLQVFEIEVSVRRGSQLLLRVVRQAVRVLARLVQRCLRSTLELVHMQ